MDPEAEFGRLYAEHRHAVHAYFVGRTGDQQAAADLMQEVFLRVWRRLAELTGKTAGAQRAWIFAVARNLSIDEHRHQRTLADATAAVARQPAAPAHGSGPASAAVITAERVGVVGQAIRRLPEQQRTALAMAAAGGLTSAQIAAALGVPAGTVRYRLSLARRSLAEALADYDRSPTTVEAP